VCGESRTHGDNGGWRDGSQDTALCPYPLAVRPIPTHSRVGCRFFYMFFIPLRFAHFFEVFNIWQRLKLQQFLKADVRLLFACSAPWTHPCAVE